MIIYNKKLKKYYVHGEGFTGNNRKEASIVEGLFAFAICMTNADTVTEDV